MDPANRSTDAADVVPLSPCRYHYAPAAIVGVLVSTALILTLAAVRSHPLEINYPPG